MKKTMLVGIRSLLAGVLIAVGPLPGALAAELNVPFEYATIQAAVDAASSGDTIRIAPGDYYEQTVIVDKENLTLAGEPGEPGIVIRAFSEMTTISNVVPLLYIRRSQVVLTNLTIDGGRFADSYPNLLFGITVVGSNVRLEGCTIRAFRGVGPTESRGISIGNRLLTGTPAINVSVLNSTFVDNTRSIVLGGDDTSPTLLRTMFAIEGNTFVGLGESFAHFGLLIFTGGGGEVRRNTMTGFYQSSLAGFSAAIVHQDGLFPSRGFVPVLPVRYEGNTFSNNDDHLVLMAANQSAVVNNIFHATGGASGSGSRWGGLAVSGTNIVVANNDFSEMPTGIVLFGNGDSRGGRLIAPASDVSLSDNWFCGVTTPVNIRSGANAIQELGTKACENEPSAPLFRPVFQAIVPLAGGGASLTLRAWHGDTVFIQHSSDWESWEPSWESGPTHAMTLPTFEFKDESLASMPHRFYRAMLCFSDPFGIGCSPFPICPGCE
jgi:hypothetical protein